MNNKPTTLLPLAITQFDGSACVAGVDQSLSWYRPVPIQIEQLLPDAPAFSYDHYSTLHLGLRPQGGQCEDRNLLEITGQTVMIAPDQRRQVLQHCAVGRVEAALSGGRSIGLVEAKILELKVSRHTRGRRFLRIVFRDASSETHDWICPEIALNQLWIDRETEDGRNALERAAVKLESLDLLIAVGLGDRNNRFPGQYGGRHPLCVGLHTYDLYASELYEFLRR